MRRSSWEQLHPLGVTSHTEGPGLFTVTEFIHLPQTHSQWGTMAKPELQGQTLARWGLASLPVTGNLALWAQTLRDRDSWPLFTLGGGQPG